MIFAFSPIANTVQKNSEHEHILHCVYCYPISFSCRARKLFFHDFFCFCAYTAACLFHCLKYTKGFYLLCTLRYINWVREYMENSLDITIFILHTKIWNQLICLCVYLLLNAYKRINIRMSRFRALWNIFDRAFLRK